MGMAPFSETASVYAESSEQQKKKKKKKKKKKSSDKKKSSKKKKKKKKRKKKKSEEESKPEEESEQKKETESSTNNKNTSRFNTAAYADELFNLTGELQASNKELARATRYFYDDEDKKQPVALESKPCLLYTSPSPRDISGSRMPSSA